MNIDPLSLAHLSDEELRETRGSLSNALLLGYQLPSGLLAALNGELRLRAQVRAHRCLFSEAVTWVQATAPTPAPAPAPPPPPPPQTPTPRWRKFLGG